VAIKVVGALLIASMLIIPAATARPFADDPEVMAAAATVVAATAILGGLRAAYVFDTPAGPTIVAVAAILFTASTTLAAYRRAR
jgi:zinc transport system permease protein